MQPPMPCSSGFPGEISDFRRVTQASDDFTLISEARCLLGGRALELLFEHGPHGRFRVPQLQGRQVLPLGLGFRVRVSRFRIQGLGGLVLRVEGLGFEGLGFGVEGLGFRVGVWGLGFGGLGFGVWRV